MLSRQFSKKKFDPILELYLEDICTETINLLSKLLCKKEDILLIEVIKNIFNKKIIPDENNQILFYKEIIEEKLSKKGYTIQTILIESLEKCNLLNEKNLKLIILINKFFDCNITIKFLNSEIINNLYSRGKICVVRKQLELNSKQKKLLEQKINSYNINSQNRSLIMRQDVGIPIIIINKKYFVELEQLFII